MKRPVCTDKHSGMTNIKSNRQELTLATYSFYGRRSMCLCCEINKGTLL